MNELKSRGIYAYLAGEHTTNLIPFGDGGYKIHVDADRLDEAMTILEEMDDNFNKEDDFREADQEEIEYEQLKNDRAVQKESRSKMSNVIIVVVILILIVLYIIRGQIL